MKRFCVLLTLALLCAGAAFGQEGKKNALSIDAAPILQGLVVMSSDSNVRFFGAGAFYERLLGSRYSLGGRFDFAFGKYDMVSTMDIKYFAVSAHGRVYPLAQGLQKFYLDAGIGFATIDMDPGSDQGGLTFALKAGYKHFFNDAIFVEPSLALVYGESIGGSLAAANRGSPNSPAFEWMPGLLIGLNF
jgi:hypothetical protein